jgi:large subunit ribosomal protein L19
MAGRLAKLNLVEKSQFRSDIPPFNVGDTLKMKIKVMEAEKLRLHPWEGIVISKRGGSGLGACFTVRKMSFGEGVEKTFPLHSPVIASLRVASKGKTKRAKLFYLRDRTGKGARVETELVAQDAASKAADLVKSK